MTVRDEQPLPVGNDQPVIHHLVQADLEQRLQVGIATYGQPLQPFNGRDALRDAYEEALDLAVYLKQAMIERDAARAEHGDTCHQWVECDCSDPWRHAGIVATSEGTQVHRLLDDARACDCQHEADTP